MSFIEMPSFYKLFAEDPEGAWMLITGPWLLFAVHMNEHFVSQPRLRTMAALWGGFWSPLTSCIDRTWQ